jgi:hypothetical protein
VATAALAATPLSGSAACLSSEIQGYTVLEFTQVDGSFEGCEHGKQIKLRNGYTLTCSTYSYSYSYSPEVVIFAKTTQYQGKTFNLVKACINDSLYDMRAVLERN